MDERSEAELAIADGEAVAEDEREQGAADAEELRTAKENLEAATATLAAAIADPLRMAAENAELAESLRGAYVLLRAVITDKVGIMTDYVVPREAWMAMDPNERLDVHRDERGDAHLMIVRRSRAERRLTKPKGHH